jgi:hypothetical protein
LLSQLAQAQLLYVTGDYVVTEQVRSRERIGVALQDANNGGKTQNWLWLKPETKVVLRHWTGSTFWDEELSYERAWQVLTPGRKFRLHAGRDWDGTLVAKKIWM